MSGNLLKVTGLFAGTEDKQILKGIDLRINAGESHVLMGPNGTGKSTFGHVLMGDPAYKVTQGTIEFDGKDITEEAADKRSLAGIFLSYQAPVEVPGVPLYTFLRTITQLRPELKMTPKKFRKRVSDIADMLSINEEFLGRDLNVGFSGGEKKKIEMLQLLLLQPKLAILDETDSGLDVDALSIVSKGIASYMNDCGGSIILITHNTRILEHVNVDMTHVMYGGTMVDSGDASLIAKVEQEGFEKYEMGTQEAADAAIAAAFDD